MSLVQLLLGWLLGEGQALSTQPPLFVWSEMTRRGSIERTACCARRNGREHSSSPPFPLAIFRGG